MSLETKIYIAGHRGMVGAAIWRILTTKGYTNLIGVTDMGCNRDAKLHKTLQSWL